MRRAKPRSPTPSAKPSFSPMPPVFGLGDILSLSEVISNPQPVPTYRKTMQADAASSVPIAQGEQSVAVDVNIVWEIE